MEQFKVNPIGRVRVENGRFFIEIDEVYRKGLQALEGFSHLNILFWFDKNDNKESRSFLEGPQPYKNAPDVMGVFATRAPMRPNPIGLTTVYVLGIDEYKGLMEVPFLDADNNTPILDVKPYTPSLDRIENPKVPDWCSHWPKSSEESGDFDWENEFNF